MARKKKEPTFAEIASGFRYGVLHRNTFEGWHIDPYKTAADAAMRVAELRKWHGEATVFGLHPEYEAVVTATLEAKGE